MNEENVVEENPMKCAICKSEFEPSDEECGDKLCAKCEKNKIGSKKESNTRAAKLLTKLVIEEETSEVVEPTEK